MLRILFIQSRSTNQTILLRILEEKKTEIWLYRSTTVSRINIESIVDNLFFFTILNGNFPLFQFRNYNNQWMYAMKAKIAYFLIHWRHDVYWTWRFILLFFSFYYHLVRRLWAIPWAFDFSRMEGKKFPKWDSGFFFLRWDFLFDSFTLLHMNLLNEKKRC